MENNFDFIKFVSDNVLVDMLTEYYLNDEFCSIQMEERKDFQAAEHFLKRARVLKEAAKRINERKNRNDKKEDN